MYRSNVKNLVVIGMSRVVLLSNYLVQTSFLQSRKLGDGLIYTVVIKLLGDLNGFAFSIGLPELASFLRYQFPILQHSSLLG